MITGIDHVLFSTSPPAAILQRFDKRLVAIWPGFILEELQQDGEIPEYFYARDQKLIDHHDKSGFSIDKNGDSCFLIIGNCLTNLDLSVTVFKQSHPVLEFGDPDPYESRIIAEKLWMYTVVLPDLIEDCPFSQKIYNYLVESLRSY